MIARIISDAQKAGKAVATVRNIRALASGLFGKAIEWGYLDANPARVSEFAGPKVAVTASFNPTSCPASLQSLAEEPNETLRDFILLALLTGARRANVARHALARNRPESRQLAAAGDEERHALKR
jgi:integrase